ncbi:poly-beta-1,6-N-acetyl-D-glucosamine N-deacetylase PgaB [Geoalkalibacter halelectricus]|uniref:Poly-beta-1,6-N-acetyl-D-glucosamine N-deacetylase PgaB n=1 Tax=Geoalkalibacter halelectricus TaxID=2847045 RepID=A0ABY5ZMW4_9BACT|nr:poly-beta-1,6-N-acetyl-D-glucosamine N-deacetylase PgaB [Geoalkalibacter halelectricus]MDO3378868.1 poly-beta-1,6-N-acetyl-D-glucosamine N-deacetylase PgaB [Geoalkalibacter halelectricus]UWZ79829.1 poly-beta-1,6-N-acetyl-D-glucosamine N-deacetylase PgaB [Geoalkalibacter halelectricus]
MRSAFAAIFLLLSTLTAPALAGEFIVLCYHDVQTLVDDPDGMSVSRDNLVAQFSWLRENGYHPVSIDDLLAAQAGEKPLPPKAVLLTFDDGYASFYSLVFPLLKAFDFPAVVAPVGRWVDAEAGSLVAYGDTLVPRERFMTWEQLREVAASGLVEVASHSFDLHYGIQANPQGNEQPAMIARYYDAATGSYETDAAYESRLRADFERNSALFEQHLGMRPRVMVWPYGAYNRTAQALAREQGMDIALTLETGANRPSENLGAVRRILLLNDPSLRDFVWHLHNPLWERQAPVRVVHADLDYIYDPDPAQQEINLGLLLDRVQQLGVNTVYLQAFADPDGDGVADALYFPNRHLPMRADLFNRVAWQLKTRIGVEVYAWMPVLAFTLGEESDLVQVWKSDGTTAPDPDQYRRLSPFSPHALRWVGEIYEDLAKHAVFDGLLFHDDALLSDFEDAHPAALAAYRAAGLPEDIGTLHADPSLKRRWTRLKIQTLDDFTLHLAEVVRHWRPALKTARNLFALPVLERSSEAWFAQSLPRFLENYDYTALMAMPYMEEAGNPEAWLEELVRRVAETPDALSRVVFELQSVDWRRDNAPIPAARLAAQMRLMARLGARHYGYYPDDFIKGHPDIEKLMPVMSLRSHPYVP